MIILALILLPLYFLLFELYLRLAKRWNITDVPNDRSSHSKVTVRGGGIIFVFASITAYFLGFIPDWILIGLIISALAGFLDDVFQLPTWPRLLAHVVGLTVLIWGAGLFGLPVWILIILILLFAGWVNAYNFMDGINGITAFYSLVLLGTFYFLSDLKEFQSYILIMILAVSVFTFYNARTKALAFAGDVGSISLAFIIGFLMMELLVKTGGLYYLLFFSVYGLDAVFTIALRWRNKENIFKPHRKHLYQYLANELGHSHLKVAAVYALTQLAINLLLIWIGKNYEVKTIFAVIALIILASIYAIIRIKVSKKISQKSIGKNFN